MKNKYSMFCEVKISNIILIVLGIGLCIYSLASEKKFDYVNFLITFLLMAIFIKDLRKYLSLKKNGKFLKNVKYEIKNRNELYLYIDEKIIKGHLTFKGKEDKGLTNIIINKNDPNEFYAFGPEK